ncbi:D-serine dehydratase [Portunus trituberculatus]|uniref:D-serine dehydratase n=1 Tax=Portunus trituberculatus TaxID=210409 RepID=A0A5B7E5W1_PORTR|nr:D-serine dehydratase [Portunus trituberculatus]
MQILGRRLGVVGGHRQRPWTRGYIQPLLQCTTWEMASQEGSARRVAELDTPAFLVDFNKVSTNCAKALAQCTELGVTLRAQTKTHKTIEGAVLQTGGTRRGLVTSTIQEAEFYADNGFDDILFGFPFIPHHMPRAAQLTRRLEKFHVMVDSRVAVDVLVANTPPPGKTWSSYLAVNCGYNRGTGTQHYMNVFKNYEHVNLR